MITVHDIYTALDAAAPFASQESYDNSGLLVGNGQEAVTKVLLALDITIPVVREAATLGAQLILSHHPVIWGGLKQISPAHPVWHLIENHITAIASHTCMDIATEGTNKMLGDTLRSVLPLCEAITPLHTLSGDRTLGCCCDLQHPMQTQDFIRALQQALDCEGIRYYHNDDPIKRIAWCGGSGGDLIPDALACGADALITGDLKHSEWCDAVNRGFSVFDCGHFFTEQPVLTQFRNILQKAFPTLEIVDSKVLQSAIYNVE